MGLYTEHREKNVTTQKGLYIRLRPVSMNDEDILRKFFSSLSSESTYGRFTTAFPDLSPQGIRKFTAVDHSREIVILAISRQKGHEEVLGMGQYFLNNNGETAEVAFVVGDDFQNLGIGRELISCLIDIGKRNGLKGFTAESFMANMRMIHLFESMGFIKAKTEGTRSYELSLEF